MTLKDCFKKCAAQLADVAGQKAICEAKILIKHAANIGDLDFILRPDHEISEKISNHINAMIQKRIKHMPIAKIIGIKYFWKDSFFVNEHTLDPRPDSETLIEATLTRANASIPLKILELGVGSGCLLLSLLRDLPLASGVGVDISTEALKVAQGNAEHLGLSDRCELFQSNWVENITDTFDIVISNPPYLKNSELESCTADTRYDPKSALVSGETGLECYQLIADSMNKVLAKGGFFAIELGISQKKDVSKIFGKSHFQLLDVQQDINGIDRCLIGSH